MPELPEVQTIVSDLNKKILGWEIVGVWTDFKRMIKRPKDFDQFRKEIKGKKITKIKRRGKLILIELSSGKTLLLHQKLTGHLLLGKWKYEKGRWVPPPGPLSEKINTFLHLIFNFKNGWQLGLTDLRKFAKVELWDSKDLKNCKDLKKMGPEPLEKDFDFEKFKQCLLKKKGKIKQILMDQEVIAGIGNIYSDEILWEAKVHPFKAREKLNQNELKAIYLAIKKVLPLAIKLRGESISDFRDIEGKRGGFDRVRKVYRREGENCSRCQTKIKRIKLAGRSAHFCPSCQKL